MGTQTLLATQKIGCIDMQENHVKSILRVLGALVFGENKARKGPPHRSVSRFASTNSSLCLQHSNAVARELRKNTNRSVLHQGAWGSLGFLSWLLRKAANKKKMNICAQEPEQHTVAALATQSGHASEAACATSAVPA